VALPTRAESLAEGEQGTAEQEGEEETTTISALAMEEVRVEDRTTRTRSWAVRGEEAVAALEEVAEELFASSQAA
jgi:hypothetical protein